MLNYIKSQIVAALHGAPNPSYSRAIDENIAFFVALYLGFEMPDLIITIPLLARMLWLAACPLLMLMLPTARRTIRWRLCPRLMSYL